MHRMDSWKFYYNKLFEIEQILMKLWAASMVDLGAQFACYSSIDNLMSVVISLYIEGLISSVHAYVG